MNLQEFAALKAGDKIENPMSGSAGEVVEVDAKGVRVRWDNTGSSVTWHYGVNSTAWMHWSKAEKAEKPCGRCEDPNVCQSCPERAA
jgi:hypothetical protein